MRMIKTYQVPDAMLTSQGAFRFAIGGVDGVIHHRS